MIYDASYDSYIQLRDVVAQIAELVLGSLLQEDSSAAQVSKSFSILFGSPSQILHNFAQFCGASLQFKSSRFRHVRRPASSVQAELSKRRAELDRRERQLEAIQRGQPGATGGRRQPGSETLKLKCKVERKLYTEYRMQMYTV